MINIFSQLWSISSSYRKLWELSLSVNATFLKDVSIIVSDLQHHSKNMLTVFSVDGAHMRRADIMMWYVKRSSVRREIFAVMGMNWGAVHVILGFLDYTLAGNHPSSSTSATPTAKYATSRHFYTPLTDTRTSERTIPNTKTNTTGPHPTMIQHHQ